MWKDSEWVFTVYCLLWSVGGEGQGLTNCCNFQQILKEIDEGFTDDEIDEVIAEVSSSFSAASSQPQCSGGYRQIYYYRLSRICEDNDVLIGEIKCIRVLVRAELCANSGSFRILSLEQTFAELNWGATSLCNIHHLAPSQGRVKMPIIYHY